MKLTAQLKLLPTPEQAGALARTLETANAACNYISDVAWATRTFGKFALQKLCYQDVTCATATGGSETSSRRRARRAAGVACASWPVKSAVLRSG
jgi:hypothetical protein